MLEHVRFVSRTRSRISTGSHDGTEKDLSQKSKKIGRFWLNIMYLMGVQHKDIPEVSVGLGSVSYVKTMSQK